MISLPTGRPGQALALGIAMIILASIWLGGIAPALQWYLQQDEYLDQQRTLAARMQSIVASAPALQQVLDRADDRVSVQGAVLEGATDAIAGATLQQAVQDMAARAGATLSSAELLPAEPVGGYRRVSLHVVVTGPWAVLVSLLSAIAQATPRMLVDDLVLHQKLALGQREAHPLEAGFTVIAFANPAAPQ